MRTSPSRRVIASAGSSVVKPDRCACPPRLGCARVPPSAMRPSRRPVGSTMSGENNSIQVSSSVASATSPDSGAYASQPVAMRASMRPSSFNTDVSRASMRCGSNVASSVSPAYDTSSRRARSLFFRPPPLEVMCALPRQLLPSGRTCASTASSPRSNHGRPSLRSGRYGVNKVSGRPLPSMSRPRRGQSAFAHSVPPPLEARQAFDSMPFDGGRCDPLLKRCPGEARRLLQSPLRALHRRHLQRRERALPGIATLGRVAGEGERAEFAARIGVELQVLDRAARVDAQAVEREADIEALRIDVERTVAAAPRQAAACLQRLRRGSRPSAGRCR